MLLIEKHIYIYIIQNMKNFNYSSPSIYFSYCKYTFYILTFVYVVLKAKFLKFECLVFHKFLIFLGASDFIND